MRFSLNTILIALVSSSVIMTDVLAVPLTKISHSGKPSRKLARRQDDSSSQNSTAVADELTIILSSVTGIALLAENVEMAVDNIVAALGIDVGDSDSGDDGQDGGDSSGGDDSGSTDAGGSGDAGDTGASDGSDDTSGSTSNQRRSIYNFCRTQHLDDADCNAIMNHFGPS
ncbi:hypothetical protein Clacol_010158 [Clathrus columnatus]|uniref:Uncharacterized protein n=1 Tax=Clathrus columnatus TaxID=1419009 RepID=A0AAV5AVI8_9AGAM|nr:hypothetical protein Clacol_010158 [Clathrus columnatus]